MGIRGFIKKLLDKSDLNTDVKVVVNTNNGKIVVPIKRIYQAYDLCLEVDIRQ